MGGWFLTDVGMGWRSHVWFVLGSLSWCWKGEDDFEEKWGVVEISEGGVKRGQHVNIKTSKFEARF